jgi:hypothetical protein
MIYPRMIGQGGLTGAIEPCPPPAASGHNVSTQYLCLPYGFPVAAQPAQPFCWPSRRFYALHILVSHGSASQYTQVRVGTPHQVPLLQRPSASKLITRELPHQHLPPRRQRRCPRCCGCDSSSSLTKCLTKRESVSADGIRRAICARCGCHRVQTVGAKGVLR